MTAPAAATASDRPVPDPWRWRDVEPVAPDAVLARGPAVPGLARATLGRLASTDVLRAAAGPSRLLVLGPSRDLPWAGGVTYLARVGRLLLPCARRPELPVELLEPLVRAHLAASPGTDREARPDEAWLVVVLPDGLLAVPEPRRPADPARLSGLAGDVR